MFQVKTRVDYGLVIMVDLAKNQKSPRPISGLAKKLKVSSAYLIQIAQSLTKAGLISSREGVNGGYNLTRVASKISLLEIFEALEGNIKKRCSSLPGKCPHASDCEVKGPWDIILNDVKSILSKRSLASLIKK